MAISPDQPHRGLEAAPTTIESPSTCGRDLQIAMPPLQTHRGLEAAPTTIEPQPPCGSGLQTAIPLHCAASNVGRPAMGHPRATRLG